jgi:ribosomal-protein-alanine N-acetyltransferase
MINLVGNNFSLRTMTAEDVTDEYLSWLSNERINKYLSVRYNIPSKEEAIVNVARYDQKTRFMFTICDNKSDKFIGTISLNIDPDYKIASYGYLVGDQKYWGTKAAVEAISMLLDFAFEELNLRRVWGGAFIPNIGSIFNFKKLGFTQEGRLRASGLIDGKEVDSLVFGILKSEWLARKAEKKDA